ncbi:MAG: CpaD family pilus assembly protein [Pseudomonadota bacterium]
MKKYVLLCAAAITLSGCGTPLFNGPNQGLSVAERHPISIDQQTVSLEIRIDPTSQGLNRGQLAEIDAFVTAYRTRGHGPITVTAPSGTRSDLDAAETAANVRMALNSFGIDYRDLQGATYRASGRPEIVVASFTRYVASAPDCGVYKGELVSRLRNMPHPNFGCADQSNLAAMVADPRDLTRMQAAVQRDGTSASNAVRAAKSEENTVNEAGFIDTVGTQ